MPRLVKRHGRKMTTGQAEGNAHCLDFQYEESFWVGMTKQTQK